jgi:hypothetical protein
MFSIFQTDGYITFGAVLFCIAIANALIWSRRRHRLFNETQRAIERLKSLEQKQLPEASKLGLAPPHEIEINTVDNTSSRPQPRQTLLPNDPTDCQTADLDSPLEPKSTTKQRLPLIVGTKIRAARNFGLIKEGTPGIIKGVTEHPFFCWSRSAYVCTFADNKNVLARPRQIVIYEHGYSVEELEQPDFATNLSKQMTLRAEQLFRAQRASPLRNMKSALSH